MEFSVPPKPETVSHKTLNRQGRQHFLDATLAYKRAVLNCIKCAAPHLHRDWARSFYIGTGTGLAAPPLHRDWAHPATSAPSSHKHGRTNTQAQTHAHMFAHTCTHTRTHTQPHTQTHTYEHTRTHGCTHTQKWTDRRFIAGTSRTSDTLRNRCAERPRRCHIGTGTGLTPATSAPGLGSPLPTSAPRQGLSLPHRHRDWAHPCPHLHRDWAHPLPTSARGLQRLGPPPPYLHLLPVQAASVGDCTVGCAV